MRGERIRLTEDAVLTARHTYELIREEGSRHAALMRSVVLAKKLGPSIENQWNLNQPERRARLLPMETMLALLGISKPSNWEGTPQFAPFLEGAEKCRRTRVPR